MSNIFISYRREESAGYAGRLFDRLVQRFGEERLFWDIDKHRARYGFIGGHQPCLAAMCGLGHSRSPMALMHGSGGRRRIDGTADYHRLEIEAGIRRGIRVIPVLVECANMPEESELPDSLKFARRNAVEISDKRFGFDTGKLLEAIDRALEHFESSVKPAPSAEDPEGRPLPMPGLRPFGTEVVQFAPSTMEVHLKFAGTQYVSYLGRLGLKPKSIPTIHVRDPLPRPGYHSYVENHEILRGEPRNLCPAGLRDSSKRIHEYSHKVLMRPPPSTRATDQTRSC